MRHSHKPLTVRENAIWVGSVRDLGVADNHANDAVPVYESVSGFRIANILVGIAITLRAFLIGSKVLLGLGTAQGTLGIVGAGAILTVLSAMTMYKGQSLPESSPILWC